MACCNGVSAETPIATGGEIINLKSANGPMHVYKRVLLCQPSSAAAERVFSLLNNSFSDRKSHSLEDYIEISVMLQYNRNS